MSVEVIQQQLRQVRYPVDTSLTLPPACYHDSTWLRYEQQRLFDRGWLGIGRTDQWKVPGDYEAMLIFDIPVVIVMDQDCTLKAFSNSCLHRSSQITSGRGRCRALVCPFHGWSYDFSGQVIAAPRMGSMDGQAVTQARLKPFHVETAGGFVFLNLQESPDPLAEWLGDFGALHQPWSLDQLVIGRQREFDVDCNWKLFLEVFNEYYHLPHVHPESINHRYPEPDPADIVMGEYTSQFGVTCGNPALLDGREAQAFPTIKTLSQRQRSGTRYTWVYPNMTFAAGADCLWMYHVFPLNSHRTRAVQTICFPPQTTQLDGFEEKAADYYHRFDCAMEEDIPALEKQQTGLQSPYAQQGRFSELEPSVGNFACWYAERMETG